MTFSTLEKIDLMCGEDGIGSILWRRGIFDDVLVMVVVCRIKVFLQVMCKSVGILRVV